MKFLKKLSMAALAIALILSLTACTVTEEDVSIISDTIDQIMTVEDSTEETSLSVSTDTEISEDPVTEVSEDQKEEETSVSEPEEESPASAPEESVSISEEEEKETETSEDDGYVEYYFRNQKLLNQHYEKHGIEMGFDSAESYEKAASDVINNPDALTKTEKEDGDFVYYVEATNEFVILSNDGYIRTYFLPDSGKKYYDKQ